MALDRWIALVILLIFLLYGYTAFFTMDAALPPFMQRTPVWPSTFPKVLAVAGTIVALVVLLGLEKPPPDAKAPDMDWRLLPQYDWGKALALLGLMVAYALLLRPAGFLLSTFGFLFLGALLLGERRWIAMVLSAAIAAGFVWWLVQEVLGIFLRPLPGVLT